MATDGSGEITVLLERFQGGDAEAREELAARVYEELRKLAARYMRRERPGHTLQTTALVNEAYIRLIDHKQANWRNRAHFFAVAARIMRRILVDHARKRIAGKRGGGVEPLALDEALVFHESRSEELLALDEALERLAAQDERASRVIELRFFAGLSNEEAAEALNISPTTAKRDWQYGRAWLKAELAPTKQDEPG